MKYPLYCVSVAIMLSGCQNVVQEHLSDDFGNAVRANIAVQTLNPDVGGPDDSASLDGQRVEQAVQRMRSRSNEVQNTSLIQGVGSN